MAYDRSSLSSMESMDETSPVALRFAPTAAVRRARSARAGAFLPGLRLSRCSSIRRSRSSKRLSSQSVRCLATSAAAPKPGDTGDSRSFDRPRSSCEYSSLPQAFPASTARPSLEGSVSRRLRRSPTAGCRAGVACPQRLQTLAPARQRPPQVGVVQVTRSMATNKAQVGSSKVLTSPCRLLMVAVQPGGAATDPIWIRRALSLTRPDPSAR